jgi:hypothetical protein
LPKKLPLSSQKYGFGIRDPRSGIRKKPIPDHGVKKVPDPGSGSASRLSGEVQISTFMTEKIKIFIDEKTF